MHLTFSRSTAGLIALGLISRNWTISTCIQNFKALCRKAFTRRLGGNIPLVGMLVDSYNHSKYETKPFHEALQAAFTNDQYLFGGQRYDQTWSSAVKVAVTTTLLSMSPMIVANYNRQGDDKCEDHIPRHFES